MRIVAMNWRQTSTVCHSETTPQAGKQLAWNTA